MSVGRKGQGARPAREPRAEGHFDAFHVALRGGAIEGRVDATRLPRLADLLEAVDHPVDLQYRIAGAADTSRPALEVSVKGAVPLVCQRCLQSFTWPIDQQTLVLLARDERELARLDDETPEHEVILADAPQNAVALIEDELVLTLPFVARCPEETCAALKADASGADSAAGDRHSAFDVLAQFKSTSPSKTRR